MDQFSRTQMLFGAEAMQKLQNAKVAVFGLGGVGGYVAEALARAGVGALDLIDNDVISLTNLNRQIYATQKTIGRYKTEVAAERIADINPAAVVRTHNIFFMPETSHLLDFKNYDYVVDAIDTVAGKIEIITRAEQAATPVISSMGSGNKTDPAAFEVADIYKTSVCPLARVMRSELKKRGIKKLKTVYSKEQPLTPLPPEDDEIENSTKRRFPGSTSFVPPVAGFIIAGEVIKDLIQFRIQN